MARPNLKRKRVTVWISIDADRAVKDHAAATNRTASDVYREALALGYQQITAHRHRYVCECGQTHR